MGLLKAWKYYSDISQIDIAELLKEDIKLILLDADNTLVKHSTFDITKEVGIFLEKIENKKFKVLIASNGRKKRLAKLTKKLDIKGRGMCMKPLPFILRKILKKESVLPENTVLIGDQIFTDVIAGNLLGIKTIYVKRISNDEVAFVRLKRKIEDFIVKKEYTNENN